MNFKNIAWAAGITMLASYMIYGSASAAPLPGRNLAIGARARYLAAREANPELNVAGRPMIGKDHPSMKPRGGD